MKKKITVNTGANIFKTRLVAYLGRKMKKSTCSDVAFETLVEVLAWVKQSDERAARKTGGLGRK